MYPIFNYNDISILGQDVFEFSDEVKINSRNILSTRIDKLNLNWVFKYNIVFLYILYTPCRFICVSVL